jgi:hypothetical protein
MTRVLLTSRTHKLWDIVRFRVNALAAGWWQEYLSAGVADVRGDVRCDIF